MGVNGKRDETRYIIFQRKTIKTGNKLEKNKGENTKITGEKKQKITRNTETRF